LNNLADVRGYESMLKNMRSTLDLEMARQNDLGLEAPYTDSNIGFMTMAAYATLKAWGRIKTFFTELF